MCSFIVTNSKINDIDDVNFFSQKRGPDLTNIDKINNISMIHNLLSITGKITPQPLNKNGIYLVYNGEIYNYKTFGDYLSDGYAILDAYEKDNIDGLRLLNGEFSFCIYDSNKNKLIFGVDAFGTKPNYYAFNDDLFCVASYKSNLEKLNFKNIIKSNPNTFYVYDFSTRNFETFNYYVFDLRQYKSSYDDWCIAFENSLNERYHSTLSTLVPMSSGYDSGGICCGLNTLNCDYISYTINGNENQQILDARLNINTNTIKYRKTASQFTEQVHSSISKIQSEVEQFYYGPTPDIVTHNGFSDPGAIGLHLILDEMKKNHNIKILFSGQGSDEVMSNIQTYGFNTKNPINFPEDLSSVFPYGNFYYGSQSSYLAKEECIAGSLGIETRYPFLDKKLVQEYLNLTAYYKNVAYKAPLCYYMKVKNYPFAVEKRGFQI